MTGKRTENRKKKRYWPIFLCLFSILALGGGLFLFLRKPDWVYLARQKAASLFSSAEFKPFTPDPGQLRTAAAAELLQGAEGFTAGEELMLVNVSYPLPTDYSPDLIFYQDTDVTMSPPLAEPYRRLSEDILAQFGEPLYIRSSFRSHEEQEKEKEEQPAVAAPAGSSEHETGMALDIYVPGYAGYGFLKSEAGQYVNSNCWKYGFIIRYPFLKTKNTGIPFEPWHIRYTGLPHSEIISKNSWTLEEYLDALTPGAFFQSGDYWISRQEDTMLTFPSYGSEKHICADNRGGYVLWGRSES